MNVLRLFTTATSIVVTMGTPSGSVVDGYEVMWQRKSSVGCPVRDEGRESIIISVYVIMGLEEDSNYTVTAVALNSAGKSNNSENVSETTLEAGMDLLSCNVEIIIIQ